MNTSSTLMRRILTGTLMALSGFLILQALGYGIGFYVDPASGIGEFGSPPPPDGNALVIALVGMVGAGMLGTAVMLVLAGTLVVKGNPAGPYVAMVIGGVYVLAGWNAWRAGWTWDAYFYSGTGGLLIVLALAVRFLHPRDVAVG